MITSASPSLHVAGIGEMVVTGDPGAILVAYGLGSCVALSVWDPRTRVAGLAHFMLPSGPTVATPPVKFVDGGMRTFLDAFTSAGGNLARGLFKAAGGAAMLTVSIGTLEIGRRNAGAVAAALAGAGLRLHASDLGGNVGRTVQLEAGSGRFIVKSVSSSAVL